MKRFKRVLLAGLALAAAQSGWAQDATIVGVRIAIGDGPVIQDGHIVVQNGRIVAVGPGRPTQVSGTVIDGSGMTALPGLVDGHKHINTGRLEKEQMADKAFPMWVRSKATRSLAPMGSSSKMYETLRTVPQPTAPPHCGPSPQPQRPGCCGIDASALTASTAPSPW